MPSPFVVQRYEKLEAWQSAHRLALAAYTFTRKLPREEEFGLVAQIRRAAASVPTNLVEGSMRSGKAQFRQFVGFATGSLAELRYQVHLCADLDYLDAGGVAALAGQVDETGRILWGLYRALGGVRKATLRSGD
jgi:four helix bundle protein